MSLIENTDGQNDNGAGKSSTAMEASNTATSSPVAVEPVAKPPSLVDMLDTLASLIEHYGLHHNDKFGKFVNDVRSFQRRLADERRTDTAAG